jgi:hypothetical protein
MPSRGDRSLPVELQATLRCGVVLAYEAPSFVPDVGQMVPCRRHGFCSVASRDPAAARRERRPRRRLPPRSTAELMAFLDGRPATTIARLRDSRFTLRVVAAAQREGLVDMDLTTGCVAVRASMASTGANGSGT